MAKKKTSRKRSRKKTTTTAAGRRRTNKKKRTTTTTKKKKTAGRGGSAAPPDGAARSGFALRDDAVEQALMTGEHRDLLESYFGEEGYADLLALSTRARSRSVRGGPRVLVLPGIMGSKLGTQGAIFDNTIWLDPIDVVGGGLEKLALPDRGRRKVEALGVILLAYLKLKLRLKAAGFDADFHPFDWRRSIDQLGADLARRLRDETASGRHDHVHLVAHSMGGLVSRAALHRLGAGDRRVRRLIMLGTPNYGSFVPVQALRATDPMVRKIAALDLAHGPEELATNVFASFPGLYQMLPAREKFSAVNLYDAATWPADGPVPRPAILRAAPAIHDKLAAGDERFTLIAGIEQATTTDLAVRDGDFEYTESMAGDGTVPLAFAQLPGVPTYYIEEAHGSLPNSRRVARAVDDLLHTGETEELPTTWTSRRRGVVSRAADRALRSAAAPFDGRTGKDVSPREVRHLLDEFAAAPSRTDDPTLAPGSALLVHGTSAEPIVVGRRRQRRLDLRLAHGSITDVDTQALVLGVFRDVAPGGAASAVDAYLDGAIAEFTDRRMFSGNVGEIFVMPAHRQQIGAELVIFVGMGPYDQFSDEVLRLTAENVARALIRTKVDDFATVMIGAGSGAGLGDALGCLVDGFFRGMLDTDARHGLRAITLCEMDTDRYRQMRTEILRLATTSLFDEVEVTIEEVDMPPASPPPPRTRRTAWTPPPVYLIVRQVAEEAGRLAFQSSVLTAGGKATVVTDAQSVSAAVLTKHLERIEMSSFTYDALTTFGSKLAELVLPESVCTILKAGRGQNEPIVVIHDAPSSRIPWETLCFDGWFPTAEAGLSRKYAAANLSVAKWLEERRYGRVLDLLLVVNPTEDLAGAEAEGDRVRELFSGSPVVKIRELRGPDATWGALRSAFQSGRYDVLHYAGHAYFNREARARSGILCHGGKVLSGAELAGLGRLPTLVFFNACEAARVRSAKARNQGRSVHGRIDRNVGLAEAFLRGGVANYVGTYWPVGDAPAASFSETFYTALLQGKTIGGAVAEGRQTVRGLQSVDWADYVHYGSAGFVLKYPQGP